MAEVTTSDASGAGGSAKMRSARSRKQRILWDSDNATADGKTSIGVLLEWLTAPGNYERWRDGKAQFGETREKLCTEINTLMRRNGITHRENANIRTQISELERSYDTAVAWLVQNGYDDGQLPVLPPPDDAASSADANGVTTSSSHPAHHAEVQVLRLCRYFHVLSAIMRQPAHQPRSRRPYHRSSSSSSVTRRTSTDGALRDGDSGGEDDSAMDTASENGADGPPGTVLHKRKAPSTSPLTVPSSMLLPAAGGANAPTPHATVTTTASAATPSVMMSSSNFANFENTQRMILEAAREDRERKRFQLDEERTKLECEKLRYELQVKKIELTVQRVVARKQLLDAGVAEDDVDALLAQAMAP